jgi:hypothetical protein
MTWGACITTNKNKLYSNNEDDTLEPLRDCHELAVTAELCHPAREKMAGRNPASLRALDPDQARFMRRHWLAISTRTAGHTRMNQSLNVASSTRQSSQASPERSAQRSCFWR